MDTDIRTAATAEQDGVIAKATHDNPRGLAARAFVLMDADKRKFAKAVAAIAKKPRPFTASFSAAKNC